jgi:hypothetical protein
MWKRLSGWSKMDGDGVYMGIEDRMLVGPVHIHRLRKRYSWT